MTDKLLRNSTMALNQFITSKSAEAINFKIGDGIINGTGNYILSEMREFLLAFATRDARFDVEVRSVNHRFLDARVRLPKPRMNPRALFWPI